MSEQLTLSVPPIGRYAFQAYHLTETLKLKEIDRLFGSAAKMQTSTRLVYQEREDSYFFIYRFGAVIFFNMEPARQNAIIEKIRLVLGSKQDLLTSEEFTVEVRPGERNAVDFEKAIVDRLTVERIDLLALILAQSTALEYFEFKVDDLLRQTGDIGQLLRTKGKLAWRTRDINRFIGYCITTKQHLVASLYLLDKPDEIWNDRQLDNLYRDAVEMFEIRDRYKTLDYKLRMVQENLELISDLLQYRHANSLEYTIVILIAVEIVLFVMQIFFYQ